MSLRNAGQGASCAPGRGGRAPGVGSHAQGERAGRRGHQQRPHRGDGEGTASGTIWYFRLSVVPIPVPPLRERAEDIPELVRHFVALFARENNFRTKRFTEAALDLMKRHQWKGNIRELRNLVERLIIMTPGDAIDAPDVGATLGVDDRATSADNTRERPERCAGLRKTPSVRSSLGCSGEHGWNISKTAEVIDTPRSNLYKKLEQYRIRQETDG